MDIVQVDLSIAGMEYLVSVLAYPYLMAQKRAGHVVLFVRTFSWCCEVLFGYLSWKYACYSCS